MNIRTLLFGTALAALTLGTALADPLRLRADVMVDGDTVRLGQLIEGLENGADIPVFRAPAPGARGTIRADRVLVAAREMGVTGLELTGPCSWSVYPYYAKLTFSPDNGFGYVRIDTLYPGDYAFANDLDLSVGTVTASNELPLSGYPNPADKYIVLEGEIPFNEEVKAILFDNTGKKVLERRIQPESLLIHEFFLTKDLPAGIYSLQLQSDSRNYRQTVKVMVE